MRHSLRSVLMLSSGLIPVSSRQLAEGCGRLSDKNANWKAQGLWLVIFLFRPRSKHKCQLSVPRQTLLSYQLHLQASLLQCIKTTAITVLRTEDLGCFINNLRVGYGIKQLTLNSGSGQLILGKSQPLSTTGILSCRVVVKTRRERAFAECLSTMPYSR